MRTFARDVQNVEPNATEGPISILEARRTVITAFLEAGAWALLSIAVLLWITLRRLGDVLLTLIPLLVAGVVTLEICVVIGMPLNFANIIALPLLLGVGVAFKIYYIMAWREGQTRLLQSVLTRAVTFSACTTATAFGSLYFSSDPGTSSMGKLLAISLLTTMTAAAFFQPVLMGKPREKELRAARAAQAGGRRVGLMVCVAALSAAGSLLRGVFRLGLASCGRRRRVGIEARIDLVEGRVRQPRPVLIFAEQRNAEIAAHHERLAVRRQRHLGAIDVAVAGIENGPIGIFHPLPLHAADDLESHPRLVAAVVRAFVALYIRILARLEKHPNDRAGIDAAAAITDEKPGVGLMGIVVNRLPKPRGARLCANRITGTDERQKSSRNRQEPCSHLAFSEAQIAFVLDLLINGAANLEHPTPSGKRGFRLAPRAAKMTERGRSNVPACKPIEAAKF